MIRILIADTHPVVRHGLKRSLASREPFTIVGEAATREELWQSIQRSNPDVLVGEMSLLGGKAFNMLKQIKQRVPYVAMVVQHVHGKVLCRRSLSARSDGLRYQGGIDG